MTQEILQIVLLTLRVCLMSTTCSTLVAIPIGMALGLYENRGTKALRPLFTALTGLPPVIAGIIVFRLFSNNGVLGDLKWIYSVNVIVVAQILIVLPIIVSQIYPAIEPIRQNFLLTSAGLGLRRRRIFLQLSKEISLTIFAAILAGFGRAIAEVGAVMMVGGNIRFKTRVMTTAVVLETNKGNYEMALKLGMILIVISLSISFSALYLQRRNS